MIRNSSNKLFSLLNKAKMLLHLFVQNLSLWMHRVYRMQMTKNWLSFWKMHMPLLHHLLSKKKILKWVKNLVHLLSLSNKKCYFSINLKRSSSFRNMQLTSIRWTHYSRNSVNHMAIKHKWELLLKGLLNYLHLSIITQRRPLRIH